MKYTDVIAKVPPAILGSAEITHDRPDRLSIMLAAIHGMPLEDRAYCRLLINGNCMMTDAYFERLTNYAPVRMAKGRCLIAGLGIGLILDPIIKKCDSVTVIENNPDVIALVAPHFPEVSVIQADIFDWTPRDLKAKFDTIYFDIWPHFNSDTNTQATKLHRRFRMYLAEDGYMESWTRIACKARGR